MHPSTIDCSSASDAPIKEAYELVRGKFESDTLSRSVVHIKSLATIEAVGWAFQHVPDNRFSSCLGCLETLKRGGCIGKLLGDGSRTLLD